MRDDPRIEWAERTGFPAWGQPEEYPCPVCGSTEAEEFYVDSTGDVVGCDMCIEREDPADWYERNEP